MPDIYLYSGEVASSDVKLRDPAAAPSGDVVLTLTKTLDSVVAATLVQVEVVETLAGVLANATLVALVNVEGRAVLVQTLDDVGLVALATNDSPPLGPSVNGMVPIRYIIGPTKNVVPVKTVTVMTKGVVPARVFAGPDNVVPVREAASETPHVEVMLV